MTIQDIQNPFANVYEELGSDYIRPQGTDIEPDSFEFNGEAWCLTAFGASGELMTYEFIDEEDCDLWCLVDGEEFQYRNPHTQEDMSATPGEWFDYLCYHDARARSAKRVNHQWAGETVEDMVNRAEHNVVEFRTQDFWPGNHVSPDEFEQELFEFIGNSPLNLDISIINKWTKEDNPDNTMAIARYFVSGEKDKFCKFLFDSNLTYDSYMKQFHDIHTFPFIKINYEGEEVREYEADYAFDISEFPPHSLSKDVGFTKWWSLHCPEIGACLIFPRDYVLLEVCLDDDGQSAFIRVHPLKTRALENKLKDKFERKWGHLLDGMNPSTKDIDSAYESALSAFNADQ